MAATLVGLGRTEGFAAHVRELDSSHALVAAVAAEPGAIAYVGGAWVGHDVEVVAIAASPGEPAVSPSPAAITSGSYPIHRPLIFYARDDLERDSAEFLRFVLGEQGQALVAEHGFVPVGVQAEDALPSAGSLRQDSGVHVTRLLFARGESTLDEPQRAGLTTLVDSLAAHERVLVVAHAGHEGLARGHDELAQQRADVVGEVLRSAGLPASRHARRSIVSLGSGDEAEQRRVDVFVIATKG